LELTLLDCLKIGPTLGLRVIWDGMECSIPSVSSGRPVSEGSDALLQ